MPPPSPALGDDPHMAHDVIYDPEAIKCCPNNNPLIDFAGHKWWTNYHWSKQSGPYVWGGNNPNEPVFGTVFDPYLATVWESGQIKGIKLEIQPPNAKYTSWRTSEVVLMDNLGYGRYLVSAGTGMGTGFASLDPNVVFGVFTYQFTPAPLSDGPNVQREIDALEILSRGHPGDAQFMLQPWDNRPPGLYFNIPQNISRITVTLDWYLGTNGQKVAKFAVYKDRYSFSNLPPVNQALAQLDATNKPFRDLIPSHGWERFHFNLWLMHGRVPQGPQEVVVDGFEYLPPPKTQEP
ncbi:MAG TPA: hypothetical protein VIS96_11645 [Terrimicrobiaceae bacterium]